MSPREGSCSYFIHVRLKDPHHFLVKIIVQENISALSFGMQEPGVIAEVMLSTPEQAQRKAGEVFIYCMNSTVTVFGLRL